MKKLSIDNALNQGYENFKNNAGAIIGIFLLILAFSIITSFYIPDNPMAYFIYQLIIALFSIYLGVAAIQAYLQAAKGKDITGNVFKVHPVKLIYLLIMWIVIAIPFLLALAPILLDQYLLYILIAPLLLVYGIYVSIYLSQSQYLIIDQKKNPIQAIQESHGMMEGNGFKYYLLMFCLAGINLVGLLCFFVGIIITAPLTEVIKAQIYQNLSS